MAEPLTLPLLAAHLEGRVSLGTYLLDTASTCVFAVFDADSSDGLERLVVLAGKLAQQGISTLLEASRRGGHLWVHFNRPMPGQVVQAWLLPYAQAFGVEFYPKQDWLSPGESGSVIRLPLGIHRKSRGWYPFVEMPAQGELLSVRETVADCCLWAYEQVQRAGVPEMVMKEVTAPVSALGEKVTVQQGNGMGWFLLVAGQFVPGVRRVILSRGLSLDPYKRKSHKYMNLYRFYPFLNKDTIS